MSANITREYDSLGQEKRTTYNPGGVVVVRTYDSLGFLDDIKTEAGDVFATGLTRDALGRLTSWTAGNGIVSTVAFDDGLGANTTGRLKQITINHPTQGNLEDLVYGFDDGDRVTSIVDQGQGLANRSFGYDGLNRLTSATGPYATGLQSADLLYGYDTIGNLLCKGATDLANCQATGGTEFDFTGATRPHAPTSINGQTPEYYGDGSLKKLGTREYQYDALGQLTEVRDNGQATVSNTYKGDGRRSQSLSQVTFGTPDYERNDATGNVWVNIFLDGRVIAAKEISFGSPPGCAGLTTIGGPVNQYGPLPLFFPAIFAWLVAILLQQIARTGNRRRAYLALGTLNRPGFAGGSIL